MDLNFKNIQVVMPVGGKGKRLKHRAIEYSNTHDPLPKHLIPLKGKPLLDYGLNLWLKSGVSRFTFLLGYKGKQIEEYLKEKYSDCKEKFKFSQRIKN